MTLALETLVELLDQYSGVYPMSPTGARGWVRARREMPKHDPEVYIEWDRSHWRYHGEMDGWTYEHHFRPVEEDEKLATSTEEAPSSLLSDVLAAAQRMKTEEMSDSLSELAAEEFIDTLLTAHEATLDSEAFVIISLCPKQEGELTIYEPRIYTRSLNPVAHEVMEIQILDLAAQILQQQVQSRSATIEDS